MEGELAMKLITLDGLLADELKDLYSAENQLIKALPKLAQAADSDDLRQAFEEHLEQTRLHVQRIEQICEQLNVKPKGKRCMGMEGLIAEGAEILEADVEPDVLDAALIGAAQRVEHYEIAAYGTARAHARQLGFMNVADLLNQTLEEEKKTDQRLTSLAENRINVEAAMGENIPVM
jgi:ferritin-like metal-binding protein YciE